MQTSQLPAIAVGGDLIPVMRHPEHEYVLPTSQVAQGYGVQESNIRKHLERHGDELVEGKHWISCVTNSHAGAPPVKSTLWTKRGVVRLGFFIRSKRAKLFRDRAEDLVLGVMEQQSDALAMARIDQLEKMFHKLDRRIYTLMRQASTPDQVAHCKLSEADTFKKVADWVIAHYEKNTRKTAESRDIHRHYCDDNDEFVPAASVNKAVAWVLGVRKKKFRAAGSRLATGFVGVGLRRR